MVLITIQTPAAALIQQQH